jgi:predicted permease
MPAIFRRLKDLARRQRLERELAEEMETHRMMTEDRLRESGADPADAAAASRRIMGNAALAREDARAIWIPPSIDSILQDLRYAVRVVGRAPGFAAAMIVVMALGIGATTGAFALIDGLVLRSLPVHEPDRLVYFRTPSFSYPIFLETRARASHILSSLVAWDMDTLHVAWATELEPTDVLMVSGEFHSTLGVGAVLGRTLTTDDDRAGGGRNGLAAVISYAAWQRRFRGDASVVGRTVRIEQDVWTIVGVTPEGFFGVAPGLAPEITIPLTATAEAESLRSTTSSWIHLLGRLRDGISLPAANAALRGFWPQVLEVTTNPGMPADRRAIYLGRATSLESARNGYSRVRNQFEQPLWLLFALVGLLLTVACASAANLLLARGIARQREIAVRLAIGAGRGRLVRQMLTESLVWTGLASAAGLLLAFWGAGVLVSLMSTPQEPIVLDQAVSPRIFAFTATLALLTAAVCSLGPAFFATRLDPVSGLKATGQADGALLARRSGGRLLVSVQLAVTVVLVFGAALFVRSLNAVLSQDAGFERQTVIVVATDAEAAGYDGERLGHFYGQLRDRLSAIPGVRSASLSQYPPISDEDGAWTQSIAVDGMPVPSQPGRSSVYFNAISPGFFRTIGTPMVRGRDFADGDHASAPRVAIVNESLARRFFPGQEPLGRLITIGRNAARQDLLIVGLVRDAKYQRLQEEPRSVAYLPWAQHPPGNLFAEVHTSGGIATVVERLRQEVRGLDATVPVRIQTVSDRIRDSLATERVLALLGSVLGLAALVLACAALYGLIAYAVSRRNREIGVRLALGATRADVFRIVISDTVRLTAVGAAAGLGASLVFGRATGRLLFQVAPTDPVALAVAGGAMLVVACLAGLFPARRAARVDPVVALRCD